ncbi:MAG: YggT family protein [Alphaproteobacteria bacterium]|nr:MAG: YggT family protein [Alphaproteobacteria bacterium]
MYSIGFLLIQILTIYLYLVIAQVIVSWLVAFNVINTRNKFVAMAMDFLDRITEPALRPIQRVLPSIGGIDVSPVVLILLIVFVQNLIREYWFGFY